SSCTCRSFFFSSRRRHTRSKRDWSSDVCSSDLHVVTGKEGLDDGGTGGGRADTVPFQTVSKLVVLQLPAAMLHRRKEAALGVQEIGRASCRERVKYSEAP